MLENGVSDLPSNQGQFGIRRYRVADGDRWDGVGDAELVGAAVQASTPAARKQIFDEIYRRHHRSIVIRCAVLARDPILAEDLAHDTFMAAFVDLAKGRPPRQPEKLLAWLYGIARNRFREHLNRSGQEADLPGDMEEDDTETASRRRLAQVERLLEAVVGTLTDRERKIYRLSLTEGRIGKELGSALETSPEQASRLTNEITAKVYEGFGALVLARDGRRYCPELAALLDEAQWNGTEFTRLLRQRILKHLNKCTTCDNCATCNPNRVRLIAPYAPVLIPLLIAERVHSRVGETIRDVADQDRSGTDDDEEPHRRGRRGGRALRVALPLLGVGLVVVAYLAWPSHKPAAKPVRLVSASIPLIAYATPTAVLVRSGTNPPRALGVVAAGQPVKQLGWSADGRRVAWLSGPVNGGPTRLTVASLAPVVSHTWSCGAQGCLGMAFLGDRLLSVTGQATLTAYPADGAGATHIALSGIPAADPANPGQTTLQLIGDVEHDTSALLFWTGAYSTNPPNRQQVFRVDLTGKATPLYSGQADVTPQSGGGVTASPDLTHLIYPGNTTYGGDICEPSDSVSVIDLATDKATTIHLPVNKDQPWRATSAWLDDHFTPFVAAYPQPGSCDAGRYPSAAGITPRVLRYDGDHWTDTGVSAFAGATAAHGWRALNARSGLSRPGSGSLDPSGSLIATASGVPAVRLGTGVTAFAWAPVPTSVPASITPSPTPSPTPSVSPALAAYTGRWLVHGSTLTISPDGTGNETWNAGPCDSNAVIDGGSDTTMCEGHAATSFRAVQDALVGTIRSVSYSQDDGQTPSAAFTASPDEPQAGDTYRLAFDGTHLLRTTWLGRSSYENNAVGNPYWCDTYAENNGWSQCGA
jgi:RNA polymerase sigma factor (sigma-70 family)